MAFLLGNKLQGTFTSASSVSTVFAITGFSHSGGDRPEIDITTGASNRRQVLPGLASPEEMTLSVKYVVDQDEEDPPNITDHGVNLRAALEECAYGTLKIVLNSTTACGTERTYLPNTEDPVYTANVDAVSWNFSTELDGIMEGEVTFRVRH